MSFTLLLSSGIWILLQLHAKSILRQCETLYSPDSYNNSEENSLNQISCPKQGQYWIQIRLLRVLANLSRPDISKEGDATVSLRSPYQSFNVIITEVAGFFSLYIIWEPLLFQFTTTVSSPPALQLCESQALSPQNLLLTIGYIQGPS